MEMECESCAEAKAAKDLWWCEAEGCHLLICSLCRCTQHPLDHADFFSPFGLDNRTKSQYSKRIAISSELKAVDMVYSTLKCANFKRRMAFKKHFWSLADSLWDTEAHVHMQLAAAFPGVDTSADRAPNTTPDLGDERAAKLGRHMLGSEEGAGDDLLARVEGMGLEAATAALRQAFKPKRAAPPKPSPGVPQAPEPKPVNKVKPASKVVPVPLVLNPSRKILVIGGEGRELQIETLFPSAIDGIQLASARTSHCAAQFLSGTCPGVRVLGGKDDGVPETLFYKPSTSGLTSCVPVKKGPRLARSNAAAIAVNIPSGRNVTFLCGGLTSEDSITGTCEKYDGNWTDMPSMTCRRCSFALVAHDGHLFAIGGRGRKMGSNKTVFSIVERLSLSDLSGGQAKWETFGDPLPTRLSALAAASFCGCIVVCGGRKEDGGLSSSCYVLRPGATSWVAGPKLRAARAGLGLAVLDGRLFAIGGEGAAHSVESVGPSLDEWRPLPQKTLLPAVGSAFAVV